MISRVLMVTGVSVIFRGTRQHAPRSYAEERHVLGLKPLAVDFITRECIVWHPQDVSWSFG